MRSFCFIVLVLLFFTSNAFGHICYSRRYSGDIRFFDINGKRIYTLFADHFSGEVYSEVERIIMTSSDAEERLLNLTPLVLEYEDRVISGQSHFTQLGSLLNSIDWIGVELPEEASYEEFIANHIDTGIDAYSLSKQNAEIALGSSPFWKEEKTDHLLYIQFPVWIKLLAEYPDILERIRITPLEDINLYLEARNLAIEFNRISARINDQLSHSDISNMSAQQRSFLQNRFFRLTPQDTEVIDSQELEVILRDLNFEDPEVIETVRDVVNWSNNRIINTAERVAFVVRSILDQEGNGIIIRNKLNKKNVEDGLRQACLDSIKL